MTPVILSGGSGTRLWPLSRSKFPKQFCEILDEALLEKTVRRLSKLGSPWVLTTNELGVLTHRLYRQLGLPISQVMLEPMARNTAPAIALICRTLQLRNLEKETVGIFPADHLIDRQDELVRALKLAESIAQKGLVVTLGIRPSYPATGFGYIETGGQKIDSDGQLSAFTVRGFREKPDSSQAQQFMLQGNFFWNAGIFVFRVDRMIENFRKLMPDLWSKIEVLKPDLSNLSDVYSLVESVSIDYGLMEHLSEQACIPCDIGWKDLGSWDDIAQLQDESASDLSGSHAHLHTVDSQNCFAFSSQKKDIGVIGLKGVIIVDTPDALLVAQRGRSQELRALVKKMQEAHATTLSEPAFETRPWGTYRTTFETDQFKTKVISVDPGARISYQSHARRAEHWIVVQGSAEVTLDEKIIPLATGVSIFIPIGAKHRIENKGSEELIFVEVQTGTYFGEDDIVRYRDDYNRT